MRVRGTRRNPLRPSSSVRRWAAMKMLSTTAARRSGIAGISVVPQKLTMPLRRDGLDPLPALSQLQAQDQVSKLSRVFGINVWLVTGYDAARTVLNDVANYSTDIRPMLGSPPEQPLGGLGFTDPPEHTRLRKFLTPEFTGRRLAAMLPRIEEIVEARLDALATAANGDPDSVVDLVPDFAFPIPFAVICELLGLPGEDRERFRQLGHARFDVTGGGAGTFGAMSESQAFLLKVVAEQRINPGDGLIGSILRDHGDEIDDVELAGLADGVFTGGYETSASVLALGTLALLQDPVAFARLGDGDDAVDRVVDELLRYLSVVQISFPRFARHDLDLFGHRVTAGDVVVCSLSAANRDEVFGDLPAILNPERASRSHLAFGHGFHRCVGSELAKMELRVAFRALARRFPDLALAVPTEELRFRDMSIVFGIDALPVRLHPAAVSNSAPSAPSTAAPGMAR